MLLHVHLIIYWNNGQLLIPSTPPPSLDWKSVLLDRVLLFRENFTINLTVNAFSTTFNPPTPWTFIH